MPTFAQRYAGAAPTADLAPLDLRAAIVHALERLVGLPPMREIVCRTVGRRPDSRLNWSDENVRGEIWDICRQADWQTFYEIVEALIGGLGGRDGVAVRDELDAAFADYRMPWRVGFDGGILPQVDAAAWGLGPGAQTAPTPAPASPPAGHGVGAPQVSKADDPPSSSASGRPPYRLPDAGIMLPLGLLAAAVAFAASLPDGVLRTWLWVLAAWLVIASIAAGVQILVAHGGGAQQTSRVNAWLVGGLVVSAIVAVVAGGIVQLRSAAAPKAGGAGEPASSARPMPTAALPDAQRTLTLPQRNAIATFAREHGRHVVFVVCADGTETLAYAGSLADAFEAGGWTVAGRRDDETRAVTHRLGGLMPNEPAVAVAPDSGIGAAVKLALENIGLHPVSWAKSLGQPGPDVTVWIGKVP
jgi:hypothetical protein